jgi:hypothetical protein
MFSSNKNIVIAKLDATANDLDLISIESFPTIKFFVRGNK